MAIGYDHNLAELLALFKNLLCACSLVQRQDLRYDGSQESGAHEVEHLQEFMLGSHVGPQNRDLLGKNMAQVETHIVAAAGGVQAAAVAQAVLPSIVTVEIRSTSEGDFVAEGSGSGVVLTADGLLVTNQHVVEGAAQVRVIFAGLKMLAHAQSEKGLPVARLTVSASRS